jgi:ferredoxin
MLSADDVKRRARALGADLVGVGNIERWEGAPVQMDPRQIMPEARSVVVMAFRIMRGSLRGIEEGTFFSNYSSMGYGGLTFLYMPLVMMNLAKFIEDEGFEAVPIGQIDEWRAIDNFGKRWPCSSRPVAPDRAAPDVSIHQRIAAYLTGLGEIGYSKVFLTPRFGPRQRLGIVLTEAELEPDPIYDGPSLCNRCMACAKDCPGNAISRDRTVRVELAGRAVEWGELDVLACDIAFRGGRAADGPEEAAGADYARLWYDDSVKITRGPHTPFFHKPRNIYNTGEAICGGRGCIRACMIGLEKRGVLKNSFNQRFRRRKPWRAVDWSDAGRAAERKGGPS